MWTARDHDVVRPWTELPEPASSRRCLRPRSSANRLARLEHGGEQVGYFRPGAIEPAKNMDGRLPVTLPFHSPWREGSLPGTL